MNRVFNFGAGPAALPLEVLQQIQHELLDWQQQGVSILEIGHRTKAFLTMIEQVENDFRELLQIPNNYKVLFLGGGARVQFSMIPLNILADKASADFMVSGFWSRLAKQEAQRYCDTQFVFNMDEKSREIPQHQQWQLNPQAAYVYYTANETIEGIEFHRVPEVGSVPLVCDMTSCIMAEPIDIKRFGLIFAGTQKNLGIAGMTVVIVREDLMQQPSALTPMAYNYLTQAEQKSILITPPVFAWYVLGLILQWLKKIGGLTAIASINQRKAEKLYATIDQYDCYQNSIAKSCRSRMNVIFNMTNKAIEDSFLQQAEAADLFYLRGHKVFGGVRASIYNAVSEQAVDTLVEFMRDFAQRHV